MSPQELLAALGRCPKPSDEKHAITGEIYGAFVGRSPAGVPCLLVPLASGPQRSSGRVSGSLALTFAVIVHFELSARQWDSPCAVIECRDETLLPVFAALAIELAERLTATGGRPNASEVAAALGDWERLLRSTRKLSEPEELGLWGELATLLRLPDLDAGVQAWRGPFGELVDLVANGIGVECKTSRIRLRHHVSVDQTTRPIGDLPVFVASLWAGVDAAKGRTLPELVADVEARTSEGVAFERALLAAGYSRLDVSFYSTRFTLLEEPLLFATDAIPRLVVTDPGISQVRYVMQLDELRALEALEATNVLRRLTPTR